LKIFRSQQAFLSVFTIDYLEDDTIQGHSSRKQKSGDKTSVGAKDDGPFEDLDQEVFADSPFTTPEKPAKRRRTVATKATLGNANGQSKRIRAIGAAKKYDNGNVTLSKPESFGMPPVWSTKRQPLCDTLPWYRAQQSAAYTSSKIVKGFMIDKEVRYTDRFSTDVIISGCGGGQEVDGSGQRTQQKDQWTCPTATYFQTNIEQQLPVGIIVGMLYEH